MSDKAKQSTNWYDYSTDEIHKEEEKNEDGTVKVYNSE